MKNYVLESKNNFVVSNMPESYLKQSKILFKSYYIHMACLVNLSDSWEPFYRPSQI